ncbi:MAG TPA: SPOR domain-containing protein, partial [Bacteroidia bacterium]|nr:SPOR domain-containing protein [Bacteroidia bacterium]
AKQEIILKTPIKDAFIVVYQNGERIGLTQASQLLNSGAAIISTSPLLNIMPNGTRASNNPSPQVSPTPNTNSGNIPSNPNAVVTPTVIDSAKPAASNFTQPSIQNNSTSVTDPTNSNPPAPSGWSMTSRSLSSANIDPAGDITVSVTIHRGSITGFAKLEEEIPTGFTATEREKQNSTFKFENGKASYLWLALPNDSIFTVSYKLSALSTATGQQTITGKFLYTANDERQEAPIPPSTISVGGSTSTNVATPVTLVNTNTNATPTASVPDTSKQGKVSFSVQVGAFSGNIPVDMANKLLQISNQGIHAHKEDNGITSYTVGDYPTYTSADLLKQELVKAGYTESFIVVYYQGKKISLQQAQALINK